MPAFDELVFHDNFEEHQAHAGRRVVTRVEALEAWDGRRRMIPNRKRQTGQYLLLGYTAAGRPITVVLLEARARGIWRAYTAWDTKPTDR